MELTELLPYADEAQERLNKVLNVIIDEFEVDITEELYSPYRELINKYQSNLQKLAGELENEINNIHGDKQKRVESKLEEAQEYLQELFNSVADLTDKHQYLVKNKERIREIIRLYNINPSEYEINIEGMSKEELLELFTISEYALNITISNSKLSDKMLSFVYKPLDWDQSDDKDFAMTVGHFLALIIVAYVAKPYFFSVVSLLYLIRLMGNTSRIRDKKKLLSVAYNLTKEYDFKAEFYNDPNYLDLLNQAKELEEEDLSAELDYVTEANNEKVEELKKQDPTHLLVESQTAYLEAIPDIEEFLSNKTNEAFTTHSNSRKMLSGHIAEMREHLDETSKKWSFLGDEIKLTRTMNMYNRSSVYGSLGVNIFETFYESDLSNFVFKYTNDSSKSKLIEFMKYMTINAISNVKEKHLNVHIFDKKDLGKDVSEFLNPSLNTIIQFRTETVDEYINKEIMPKLRENIAKIGNSDINTYNTTAEADGLVTIDYNLFIVISTEEDDPHENRALKPLMEYSAKYGMQFLVLAKDESLFEEREQENSIAFQKDTCVSKVPYEYTKPDGTVVKTAKEGYGAKPYTYSFELGHKVLDTLLRTLEENRSDILDYENGYRSRYIPDEKIWTYKTRKGIELKFGLQDGDPTKPFSMSLGDDAVHCLMAGATGAGKSATINQILANLFHMYPPEELEMVMIDFKNVEFSMYTGDNLIPHAKIIAGTKDGEYAVSVFDYLLEEMERRTRLFTEAGVQKLEDYNNKMDAMGTPEKCLPRILVLIDEYQVMFTEVDEKAVAKIRERITSLSKLARFAGCHMWFTSQSMAGTMSQDIMDQFKLRAALGCSEDVSMALIGNKAAAKNIKSKGYIYTNHTAGMDETANKFWRIPFIPGSYINKYLPMLNERIRQEGRIHRQADFYDEKKRHEGCELSEFYENNPQFKKEAGLILLGEKTSFTTNRAPINFKFKRDDGEHAIASMFERESMLNFANTMLTNFESRKEEVSYVVHCPDKDTIKLMGLEERLPDNVKAICNPRLDINDIMTFLQAQIDNRIQNPKAAERELYMLCINWEKMDGIGRNYDWTTGDKFKRILQDAAILNIHIILCVREVKECKQLLGLFNHRFISYHNDAESYIMLDNAKAKLTTPEFCFYLRGSTEYKFKLYDFPLVGELEESEIVLEY